MKTDHYFTGESRAICGRVFHDRQGRAISREPGTWGWPLRIKKCASCSNLLEIGHTNPNYLVDSAAGGSVSSKPKKQGVYRIRQPDGAWFSVRADGEPFETRDRETSFGAQGEIVGPRTKAEWAEVDSRE